MNPPRKPYGIVTYHDGFNYGAYLQVYALQKVLNGNGLPTEIVNYKSRHHWRNEYRSLLWTKRPKLLAQNLLKLMAFKAEHKRLPMSPFSTQPQSFSGQQYEAVIYGSDEIWNYANPLLGLDAFYFGAGMDGTRKIAYAPSCGNLPSDAKVPDDLVKLWESFESIAVRDFNSQKILSRYRTEPPPIVLDPTFLHDFRDEIRPCTERNFVLVYTTGFKKDEERAVRAFAERQGKKLISIGYRNPFCDKSVIGVGPFEFLGYYAAADHVVTSMFHGTIFAIKAQKNFAVLVDPYRTNKLAYILDRLQVKDRVTDAAGLAGVLSQPIDHQRIQDTLRGEVRQSQQYLIDALRKK